MDGTVTDPQGAVVIGAEVTVTNSNTGASFKATTDEHGQWALPSMPEAPYRVSVTMKGFRTTVIDRVVMDAGIPVTVNARLEIGQMTETVEVSGTQELVQTSSANVANSLEKRQMTELPMLSRNGLDMLMSLPGIQSGSANRNSTINGLPSGAISITVDGLNTQDNTLKSSSGSSYFTYIPILQDSVEEVVLSGAAANADSTGEGAAQVKFVTRSGTNEFHGGAFWQNRNTALTANSYFNTINRLPRSIVKLNQFGFHVGGPVYIPKVLNLKNKLFFFTNVEFRKLPQSAPFSRTIITPAAAAGAYTYPDSAGVQHTVNVLSLAKAAGFNATPDPIVAQTFSQVLALTGNCGSLVNNIPSSDYDTNTCAYTTAGTDRRHFSMTRMDYNLNSKNQFSLTYSYNMYNAVPDVLNSVVPIYPGTGDILGSTVATGQTSNRFMGTIALRSTITSHLTNAFQGGLNGGTVVFGAGASSPANYAEWRGYIPTFGIGLNSGISSETAPQRRNDPVKQFSDTLSWLKGAHMITVGGDFAQINYWGQYFGSETFPGITFGNPSTNGDPVHSGSTDVFTTASMPGATQTYLDNAATLYATLTGRVSSITRQVVESETTHQYGNQPLINRDQQRQFGFFAQDQWRIAPNLTFNLGLRFEAQGSPINLSGTYTASSIQAVYGISGIGNMFKPGVTTGGMTPVAGAGTYAPSIPAFTQLGSGTAYNPPNSLDPNVGLAWQIPTTKGLLRALLGDHQGSSVLRAGFSMSTIRENIAQLSSMYGSNPGLTYPASVDPVNYPSVFGPPGSVLFSQPTFPVMPTPTAPTYPLNTSVSTSINAFDPNLKLGYVESWNVGFQREFAHNNVIEIRYQGNHEVHGWRQVQVNEVNLFESGFLTDFYNAYNNLLIARGGNILNTNSNNFGNQGLPGQVNIPILQTALGSLTNNSSYATYVRQNRAGSLANVIWYNATYMGHLISAGYPANLFVVNPSVGNSGAWLVNNGTSSFWDAGVFEYRRRLASGLQLQANYVWSKSLANGSTGNSSVYSEPTTFRNLALDKLPPGYDIRQAFKLNFIYELPFGAGKPFLSGNSLMNKVFGGWQVTGIDRNQTGTPTQLTASRTGMNGSDTGVVLENMTTAQLQSMMAITKGTGSNGIGQVWWLPKSPTGTAAGSTFINNSQAAFEASGYTWTNINSSAPYVAPQLAPGKFGYRVFIYGPMQNHFDASLSKRTTFAHEKANLLIQANCLNCLNLTDFYLANVNPSSSSFGLTTSAYTDISNTNDPGGRILEFIVRVNF
ncbi:MAG: TonB-dependent receptor [Bryobacteraceae bacterium]|jgi:hypothetical protein